MYYVPPTHKDIDVLWDSIERIFVTYGRDIALIAARELNVYQGADQNFSDGDVRELQRFRSYMHDSLDGKTTGLEAYRAH